MLPVGVQTPWFIRRRKFEFGFWNVWVYDPPQRGSKVQKRIIPFAVFHQFQDLLLYFHFYPQLSARTTNDSAFNSCLKAANLSDRHAPPPPQLEHLWVPFCTESPAGPFFFSVFSPPLWPGFQVDRMTNGVWSPLLIRCNRTRCFSAPPGETHTEKRGLCCRASVAQIHFRCRNMRWNHSRWRFFSSMHIWVFTTFSNDRDKLLQLTGLEWSNLLPVGVNIVGKH